MSVINPLARELSAKIVYYGPGMSGKTTSLSLIHSSLKPTHRGDLISLATEGDRTLFFDFLPIKLGKIRDLNVRLQLYTVPGQVFYGATRRLVLDGADGVVFVADSQRAAAERNLESLNDLRQNLEEFGTPLENIPFVLQYNKRDLPDCMSEEEMRAQLNTHGAPDFLTVAAKGEGVTDALKSITRLVVTHLGKQTPQSTSNTSQRQPLPLQQAKDRQQGNGDGFASHVSDALADMGKELRNSSSPDISTLISQGAIPLAPELNDLGQSNPPPHATRASSRQPLPHSGRDQPVNDAKTIQAPAAAPLSFSALWDDDSLVRQVEGSIADGHFAEAVYRAAGGVSAILDALLGPYAAEGSATRAQLLGLDGHEYLQLRRLCSQPTAVISKKEALFALYVLVAVRIKEASL